MESAKKRVFVVAGILEDLGRLDIFKLLPVDRFETTVCLLGDLSCVNYYRSHLAIKVFQEIKDMPGYMRGLEVKVKDADLLICFETSRLSSFQGLRIGLKRNIPVIVFDSEIRPFHYHEFVNTRTIQDDIYGKSSLIVSCSDRNFQKLELEEVCLNKIRKLPMGFASDEYFFDNQLRLKFSKYIGLKSTERLVTFFYSDIRSIRIRDFLHALTLVRKENSQEFSSCKFLLVGPGADDSDVKHLASDLGLVKSLMFLHQDIRPFARDLFCASDIIVYAVDLMKDQAMNHPRWILDGMACGAIPIVFQQSCAVELVGDGGQVIEDGVAPIYQKLSQLLFNDQTFIDEQVRQKNYLATERRNQILVGGFIAIIDEGLLFGGDDRSRNRISEIEQSIAEHMFREALVDIEDDLLRVGDYEADVRARLLTLRGDAQLGLRLLNPAMQSYEEASQIDSNSYRAYVGLGRVAYQSQAYEDALIFFKRAMAVESESRDIFLGLGLTYKALGRFVEAIYWLQRCIVPGVQDPSVLIALIQVAQHLDDQARAIQILEDVREVVGDAPALIMGLGKLYISSGLIEEGQRLLSSAIGGF